jgi:hypothetical protein
MDPLTPLGSRLFITLLRKVKVREALAVFRGFIQAVREEYRDTERVLAYAAHLEPD